MAPPRIYLTGHVSIEHDGAVVDERELRGRQSRVAFVYLTLHRARPITRQELVDAIWADLPAPESDAALNAILSRLRSMLKRSGAGATDATIDARSGCVGVRLPNDTWIDLEAAANAVDEAEGALRVGDSKRAWGCANVVVSIARRSFLPDHEAPWIEAQRARQRTLLTRGLRCLAATSASIGDHTLAIEYTNEVLALEPFLEVGYQELMRLHAAMGNRAEALRVFGRCRELLKEELGASPSPQTEAVFLEILRAGAD